MPPNSFEDRLEEIRRAEYASDAELILRVLLIAVGTLAFYLLTGDHLVLLWFAAHVLFELLLRFLLTGRNSLSPGMRLRVFMGAYLLSNLTFAALPLYLIGIGGSVAVVTTAVATLVGLVVYVLHRRQRERSILRADSMTLAVVCLVLLGLLVPQVDGLLDTAMILTAVLGLTVYTLVAMTVGMHRQIQLRDAQKRYADAQKARALNQFVGGVAHDFNNQLTAILGNLELSEVLDNPQDRAGALAQARQAADRAALTVKQLLASSGRQRLNPVTVDMAAFVAAVRNVLVDLLDKSIAIEVVAPSKTLAARADRDMLETCVIQLCLNAQDVLDHGGRITIRAERCDVLPRMEEPPETAPPLVALIIEDNGPGVPDEALDRLAEPFYTTKPASDGRGLGLSAVSGFARQSHGALLLDHRDGGGLRATMLLPEARR